ncbi:MAG: autotransporter outer membrane beta-barrel domain-containing protein [Gammaproteobacteria bacterium]|nr:autotransporter outer membrane beta-barrel domain-containing protein [Gammaproteobacteria bacterium]
MDLNLQQLAGYSSPVQLGTTSSPEGGQSYRFSVDLKGYDPSTARVQGRWAADKFGSDILINGISTGQQTEATGFLAFTDFEITSGFDQGMNTIDFETDNEDDVAGLRVAGTVTARLYESILAPRQNLTMARAWTTLVSNQYDLLHYAPRVVPEPCGFETFVDVRHTDHERSTTPVEGASDYSANTTTVGASYGFCKGPVVTAQFGYTDAELDAEDSGRWDAESYNFAVRGDHNVGLLGRAYLFSLIISGGKGDSDSDRTSLLPTGEQVFADGVDAWNIMGMARVATTFEFQSVKISPFASAGAWHVNIDDWRERGAAANVSVLGAEFSQTVPLTTVGLDLRRDFLLGNVKIAPNFSAAWRHEFADRIGSVQGRLAGETVMLTALPLDDDRDTALVELGLDVQPAKRVTMNVGYNRELGGAYRSYEWFGGRLSIEFCSVFPGGRESRPPGPPCSALPLAPILQLPSVPPGTRFSIRNAHARHQFSQRHEEPPRRGLRNVRVGQHRSSHHQLVRRGHW